MRIPALTCSPSPPSPRDMLYHGPWSLSHGSVWSIFGIALHSFSVWSSLLTIPRFSRRSLSLEGLTETARLDYAFSAPDLLASTAILNGRPLVAAGDVVRSHCSPCAVHASNVEEPLPCRPWNSTPQAPPLALPLASRGSAVTCDNHIAPPRFPRNKPTAPSTSACLVPPPHLSFPLICSLQ